MARPPDMTRSRYLAAALLDRASAARPVSRAHEFARAVRATEPRGLAPDGLPYPPARLRVRVARNGDPQHFFDSGRSAADAILDTLDRAGVAPSDLRDVLDFGCGCGRVARHLREQSWRLSGCDYHPGAVDWCQRELPFMRAVTNGLEPPAPYPDDSFDLVCAVSVLTHLTDALGRSWVSEWRRALRPGGLLLITTHGDLIARRLNSDQTKVYGSGKPVVTKQRLEGMNACVAHHPSSYVTGTLLDGLDLLAALPGGTTPGFLQDSYVARVP